MHDFTNLYEFHDQGRLKVTRAKLSLYLYCYIIDLIALSV